MCRNAHTIMTWMMCQMEFKEGPFILLSLLLILLLSNIARFHSYHNKKMSMIPNEIKLDPTFLLRCFSIGVAIATVMSSMT